MCKHIICTLGFTQSHVSRRHYDQYVGQKVLKHYCGRYLTYTKSALETTTGLGLEGNHKKRHTESPRAGMRSSIH